MTQILKQKQYTPQSLAMQVAVIWAATKGYFDDVKVENVSKFEKKFSAYLKDMRAELLGKIEEEKRLSGEIEDELRKAVEEYKRTFGGKDTDVTD